MLNYSDQWWLSLYITTAIVVIFGSEAAEENDKHLRGPDSDPLWLARYIYCSGMKSYSWSEGGKPYNSGDPRAGN